MRIKQYLKNDEYAILFELLDVLYYNSVLSEGIVPDIVFNSLKRLGNKLGFKISRANSFFDYLAKAEEGLSDLVTNLTLYALADGKQKEELKDDIKHQINHVNKKELSNFFLLLDRSMFGFSSFLRNILIAVFGVEISTYKKWSDDIDFIEDKIKEIRIALFRLNPTKEEVDALDDFETIVKNTKDLINIHEEDGGGGMTGASSGATTTDNVAKFWPKLGPTTRRKKKNKKLRKLLS